MKKRKAISVLLIAAVLILATAISFPARAADRGVTGTIYDEGTSYSYTESDDGNIVVQVQLTTEKFEEYNQYVDNGASTAVFKLENESSSSSLEFAQAYEEYQMFYEAEFSLVDNVVWELTVEYTDMDDSGSGEIGSGSLTTKTKTLGEFSLNSVASSSNLTMPLESSEEESSDSDDSANDTGQSGEGEGNSGQSGETEGSSNQNGEAGQEETNHSGMEGDTSESKTGKQSDKTGSIHSWLSPSSLLCIVIGMIIGLLIALIMQIPGYISRRNKENVADKAIQDADRWDGNEDASHAPGQNMSASEQNRRVPGQRIISERNAAVSRPGMSIPEPAREMPDFERGTIGKVHHIGRRRGQQDTLGFGPGDAQAGLLAVVSDGMGGLADGDKVSQLVVRTMIESLANLPETENNDNPLYEMLCTTNERVLKMLGPDQIYKSGATLLAVLVKNGKYHWVTVGDSRIYLYCSHHLLQVNREHIFKQEIILDAINRKTSFARVNADPQKESLISFLGMGDLEYMDGSLNPIELKRGDRLLLMSDGIFNTISEETIIRIIESTPNAKEAAALMEQQVLAANNPRQDNFTCIILEF